MDPAHRTLVRVGIEDNAKASVRVSTLMGDRAENRRRWIEDNICFTLEDDYKLEGNR